MQAGTAKQQSRTPLPVAYLVYPSTLSLTYSLDLTDRFSGAVVIIYAGVWDHKLVQPISLALSGEHLGISVKFEHERNIASLGWQHDCALGGLVIGALNCPAGACIRATKGRRVLIE